MGRVEGYTTVFVFQRPGVSRTRKDKSLVDLYLIDIHLPDGDGLDVVRVLRTEGTQAIILISGRGEEIDTVLGLELGADDYIVKPFRVRELPRQDQVGGPAPCVPRHPARPFPAEGSCE